MKWGLITDTHDKFELVKSAIAVCESTGCSQVFHGGDFNTDRVAGLFRKRPFGFYYVTDHNSHDRGMRRYRADSLDRRIDGNSVFMFHDTYPRELSGCQERVRVVDQAIARGSYDFVFYGHLHYFNLKLPGPLNGTVVVNAGGFYHEALSTFCILDLEAARLEVRYWTGKAFAAILRFDLFKGLEHFCILDEGNAAKYAAALRDLRWGQSDRLEHVLSEGEDACWWCKNYTLLFERLGMADRPGFFVQ